MQQIFCNAYVLYMHAQVWCQPNTKSYRLIQLQQCKTHCAHQIDFQSMVCIQLHMRILREFSFMRLWLDKCTLTVCVWMRLTLNACVYWRLNGNGKQQEQSTSIFNVLWKISRARESNFLLQIYLYMRCVCCCCCCYDLNIIRAYCVCHGLACISIRRTSFLNVVICITFGSMNFAYK